jgi:hypothetical protein
MLSLQLQEWALLSPDGRLHPTGIVVIAILGLLLIWRIVRFTVYPALHPSEPKEYPYWLPGFGHLGSFLSNAQTLLTRSRYVKHLFGNAIM